MGRSVSLVQDWLERVALAMEYAWTALMALVPVSVKQASKEWPVKCVSKANTASTVTKHVHACMGDAATA